MSRDFSYSIQKIIRDGIRAEAERLFTEEKEAMLKQFSERLDMQKDKIIAATAIRMSRRMDIATMADRLVITIEKDVQSA